MRVSRKALVVPVFVVALGFASAAANATTLEKAARIKEATVSTDEVEALAVTQVSTGILRKFEVVELNGAQVRKTASLLWEPIAHSPDTTFDFTGASTSSETGPSGVGASVEISSEDFRELVDAPSDSPDDPVGMQLFFQGKLKIAGNVWLATRLQACFKSQSSCLK